MRQGQFYGEVRLLACDDYQLYFERAVVILLEQEAGVQAGGRFQNDPVGAREDLHLVFVHWSLFEQRARGALG